MRFTECRAKSSTFLVYKFAECFQNYFKRQSPNLKTLQDNRGGKTRTGQLPKNKSIKVYCWEKKVGDYVDSWHNMLYNNSSCYFGAITTWQVLCLSNCNIGRLSPIKQNRELKADRVKWLARCHVVGK